MRETGPVSVRTSGDEDLALQRLGVARTLLGRLKARLGGLSGAQSWRLDDGTVIRARVAGDVQIVEIDVTSVARPSKPGYYFVYLFGSITDEPPKIYGWRIERDSDVATPIQGMPMPLNISVPSGGRLFCSADNHQHSKRIVVFAQVFQYGGDETNPAYGQVGGKIFVFSADEVTGKLKQESETDASQIVFSYNYLDGSYGNAPGAYFPPRLPHSLAIYSTQDPNKYIVIGAGYVTFVPRFQGFPNYLSYLKAFLFDVQSRSITEFDYEESVYGGNNRSLAYEISKVGMRRCHPNNNVFYTASLRQAGDYGPQNDLTVRAYEYSSPSTSGGVVAEWRLTFSNSLEISYGDLLTPVGYAVTEGGDALVISCKTGGGPGAMGGGWFIYNGLSDDGRSFTSHILILPDSMQFDLTNPNWANQMRNYFHNNYHDGILSDGNSAYLKSEILTLRVGDSKNVAFHNRTLASINSEGYITGQYGITVVASPGLAVRNSDKALHFLQYVQGDGSVLRRGQSAVRLLNHSRIIASVPSVYVQDGFYSYHYEDTPRLRSYKVFTQPNHLWWDTTFRRKLDIALPNPGNAVQIDILYGIAVFEPLEGRTPTVAVE